MIGSFIGSVVLGGLGKVLGFFNERSRIQMYAKRDLLNHRYQMQRADYEYRTGRNAQIAAIQGKHPKLTRIMLVALSTPVVLTFWFLFAYWWLEGEWYPVNYTCVVDGELALCDGFPPTVDFLVRGVLSFWLLAETGLHAQSKHYRQKLLLDPENQKLIEGAGQRRKKAYTDKHGPKGQ